MRTMAIPDLYTTARNLYSNDLKIEMLCIAVCEIVPAIMAATDLSEHEVIGIVSNLQADSASGLCSIDESENPEKFERISPAKLVKVIRKYINSVADMAELDPDEVVNVFAKGKGSSIEDLVSMLRIHRWNHSNGNVH